MTRSTSKGRAFAERIINEGGSDADSRLTFAFKTAVSREPRAAERSVLNALVEKHSGPFQDSREGGRRVPPHRRTSGPEGDRHGRAGGLDLGGAGDLEPS